MSAEEQQTTSPAAPSAEDEGPVTLGWRALAVILGVALLVSGLVFVANMVDTLENPVGRAACLAEPGCTEYYDGSSGERVVNVILGFGAAGFALLGAVLAVVFAARGTGGGTMLWVTGAAIVLGAATIAFGAL
jgi:hypothetical protein